MNTVANGKTELQFLYNCTLEILSFGGGQKEKITIGFHKRDCVRFYISPYTYSLALEWKILQNNHFIKVEDLIKDNDGFILDKFNREKAYIVMSRDHTTIGWPNTNIWYDKDLVIQKEY